LISISVRMLRFSVQMFGLFMRRYGRISGYVGETGGGGKCCGRESGGDRLRERYGARAGVSRDLFFSVVITLFLTAWPRAP